MIQLKRQDEIDKMAHAGELLAQVFAMLDTHMVVGISTMQIDTLVDRYISDELNARPASKGQYDYPYSLNCSFNHVVCHGMPNKKERLADGDIINIDITLEKNGYIADSSKMYLIGNVSEPAKKLVSVTYECLMLAIQQVKPGNTFGDIGYAIQKHAEKHGYSVVKEYCGHGIGTQMHEAPQVLHFGRKGQGEEIKAGMTFTIEPMINQGTHKTKTLKDGWTVITKDKKLSAQWEHTLAVTENGVEVLTKRAEETF
jgi:methionyl aminopeptidase